nr:S8 family serine peptidase [Candidatus Sigynarchaeota archaeon]
MGARKNVPAIIMVLAACWSCMVASNSVEPPSHAGSSIAPASIDPAQLTFSRLFGVQELFWNENITGANQAIAIIDTGINASHPAFAGKTVYWKDATNESYATARDISGHGTMCASIVAGNATDFKGFAPDADIAAIKMFFLDQGEANAENPEADAAISYLLANAATMHVKVASLSWGDDNQSDGNDHLSHSTEQLVDAGITTVVAQGNFAGSLDHVAAPGTSRKVITVGALDQYYFRVASFSLPGPTSDGRIKPDIIAPGVEILGANANTNGYKTGSGTSFATPIVAGIAALLHEKYPGLSHYQLKNLFCLTALECQFTNGDPDVNEGWGIVNPAGVVMAKESTWNKTAPIFVQIAMNRSMTRSFFTRVALNSGITHQISINYMDPASHLPMDASSIFQAYIFSEAGDEYGVPRLLAKSHDGRLLFSPLEEGTYILAIKPLPSAWYLNEGDLAIDIEVVWSQSLIIQLSWIIGISLAGSAVALVLVMERVLINEWKELKKSRMNAFLSF